MDIFTCTPQQWLENEENFLKQLDDCSVWDKIPLLNVNKLYDLKESSLVRFRGMIQDMHSPEYYLEKFEVVNQKVNKTFLRNGKYCDPVMSNEEECVNFDSKENVTSERHTYVVISVPGINDWVKIVEEEKYRLLNMLPASSMQAKRTYEETLDSDVKNQESTTFNNIGQKKICTEETSRVESNSQVLSKESILNFPLPNRNGKACHLKVYTNSDELKLNDICEFVGFLAIDPLVETCYQDCEDNDNKMEIETLHPPSSIIPRIHCVNLKKLKHDNPLLNIEDERMDLNKINFIRKELLIVLTQLLLGDELAAEYLIYHLMSEVYLRRDCMPLGKFSLNISNVPQLGNNIDFVMELYKFIERFMPKSHYLPMTLENMNQLTFIPKKDYECNRLISGILQLSCNTHLVLDETKLCAGKLNAAGVNSIKAIAYAIKNQTVTYDFNYYPLEFECDIPFLIMSEGKSMINVDTHIVLKPEDMCLETFGEIVSAAQHFLNQELLNNIRKYLTLARLTNYTISDNVEDLIQSEFVNMRQREAVTPDDLHSLLVLARLICISHGKTTLDKECWYRACRLEKERKARLSS